MNRILYFMFFSLFFLACDKSDTPDCFKKAGDVLEVRRDFDSVINALEIHDYIHIEIIPSEENYVILSGPKNLLPKIKTEQQANKLIIANDNTCNFVRSYKKQVTLFLYMNIAKLDYYGTGDVLLSEELSIPYFELNCHGSSGRIDLNISCDSCRFNIHTGQSDVFVKGTSNLTYLYNAGINVLDASNLFTENAFVNSNSIHSIYVYSDEYLSVVIGQSGSVYYSGEPNDINLEQMGSGSLLIIIS